MLVDYTVPALHCMPATTSVRACPQHQMRTTLHVTASAAFHFHMHALIMLVVSHLQDQAAQKAGETKEAAKVSSCTRFNLCQLCTYTLNVQLPNIICAHVHCHVST